MDLRFTSVVRSTRSGNLYNVPLSPSQVARVADSLVEESAAAAWGTSTVRRMDTPLGKSDLNASLENAVEMAGSREHFLPSFAFDVNTLVSTLHRSASGSSLASSFGSSRGAASVSSGPRETVIMSVEPVQPRRGRRGAVTGKPDALSSRVHSAAQENSIFAYSLNKKKQRKLAAAALAASAGGKSAPNYEHAGVQSAAGYSPQYIVPQYRQPAEPLAHGPPPPVTRDREPSIYTESFAF